MEERQLFGALTVYRERGFYLRRLEQFVKAEAAYDEAFRNCPDDVRTLTGRSQVCSDAVHPEQAYADAALALELAPGNVDARNVQARALYTMTNFERSYIKNSRGLRIRSQPPYFQEGANQCKEIIEDCIGKNAGHVLLDFLPLIKNNEANTINHPDDEPQEKIHISRIPRMEKKKPLTLNEARKHSTLSRVLAMKYLGPMAYDKFFLQNLMNDKRIQSANASGTLELKQLIKETLLNLSERQETLRTQRPYYTVKLAEKAISSHQDSFKKYVLSKEREFGARSAENFLKLIDKRMRERRIADMMSLAERMQLFLDKKTRRTLPDKDAYIDRLYRLVGEGYLCQHRLSYTLSERGNRSRIAFLMGLPVRRPTSYDSVIARFPHKFVDVKEATAKVEATLELCENHTMKCWLQYELARLLCMQKNYALAKLYAKRCQKIAHNISNPVWWLNGSFVLISGDMQQANANEVRIAVEEALVWSKKVQDSEQVQSFLIKCAEMASRAVTVDDRQAVVQRERQICGVLDEKTSVESEVLFKRIATVPPGRRFAVLPGRPMPGPLSERRRRRQRGITVVPGREKALPPAPKSKTPGFQKFDV